MFRSVVRFAATALAILAVPLTAAAASPTTALVEGVLTAAGGAPAADGDYDVTFALYDAETGGTKVWSEGPTKVKVAAGRFVHALGAATPIDAAKLAAAKGQWLGLTVGSDPELPLHPLRAGIFAMHAATADALSCDGCVGGGELANGAVAAAKIGFNFAGSSTKGGPAVDLACTACVSVTELKFDGDVDLAGNSLKAKNGTFSGSLAAAEFVGDGSKLTGIKISSGTCKNAGEVVKGINPDGSLQCVAAMDPAALPKDGLNEISNDLLSNQFVDTIAGEADLAIPDNTGADANAKLDFPDIGIAQDFELSVEVINTDFSAVALTVLPPDDKKVGWTLCDPCGEKDSKSYKATFNSKDLPQSGDLKKWIGQNPKGLWNLKALDTSFCITQIPGNAAICDTKLDGKIVKWSIKIQTLSNKKIAIAGDAYQSGSFFGAKDVTAAGVGSFGAVKVGGSTAACDEASLGTMRWDAAKGLQLCGKNWDNANKVAGYAFMPARTVPIVWSGGCTSHSQGSGWDRYCLNGTDFNTSADYLDVNTNGVITVKISGWYRLNFWVDQHGCGHKRAVTRINGKDRAYSHQGDDNHRWNANTNDLLWPLRKGDTIEFWAHHDGGCNPYRWHSWNKYGQHSRTQVEFHAPLQDSYPIPAD